MSHRLRGAAFLLAALAAAGVSLGAQTANRIPAAIDPAQVQALPHHLPPWASAANDRGPVASSLTLESMTLVLARSPQQQAALTQLLADQQNPASPSYHHWLTPDEMGLRFGLSDQDIATLTGWLQSQGLHVNWVAPNRIFLGFGGAAADVNRAFQTELHTYTVDGESRYSIDSDPAIPAALAPAIQAIRGLSTPSERPDSHVSLQQSASPQMTVTNSNGTYHYIAPADFATIYDIPASYTGAGYTIGIVGWSRVDLADLANFRLLTGAAFHDPTEVVPTAYGGTDPGNPYTTQQGSSVDIGGQTEATLDVLRAGSTAPAASLLLVVSAPSSPTSTNGDGIGADAQYLVNTSPVPAQIMSISFGECETGNSSEVNYWDSLFQTAAGEGISVFVSSGDSGAAGCDTSFKAPPATPKAISPNAICSSTFATCVGGTEFNDSGNPSGYWGSTSSNTTLESVYGYIPEGGWNESTTTSVAASGGGVSSIIATPTWQTGTGLPAARTGRYTPDVSFSAAGHDSYFGCLAAAGGSCVVQSNSFNFVGLYGTSAAAPAMAGIAALLDQKLGHPQGNLNPGLYKTAAYVPLAFHDTTVATSGVSSCSLSTASMCNNSIPNLTGGAQQGYELQAGYDEVTGLGSADVTYLLDYYTTTTAPAPTVTTGSATNVSVTTASLNGTLNANGANSNAWFLYGTSNTLSGATQVSSVQGYWGNTITDLLVNLSGLIAGTTYYFQAFAQNPTGTTNGAINSFTTSAPPLPVIYTGAATSITSTTATLSGTGGPSGSDTQVWFLYGRSSTLAGASKTASQDIGTGTLAVGFTANLTGLTPYTTYYFQAVAQNITGTVYGDIHSFISSAIVSSSPVTTTGAASAITFSSATLSGTVNPNGADTQAWFLFGTSSTIASPHQTASQELGAGTTASSVTTNLSGLSASTIFYYQLVAQNGDGTTYGAINTFTTATAPSFTISGPAVTISSPGASTGNTSTITITSLNGFADSVVLTASLATSPSGALYPPTLSFGSTTSVNLTSGGSQQATLTISTTASSTAALHRPGLPWYGEGGAALACLLLFGIPARRRRWLSLLGMVLLLATIAGGVSACGGGGSGSGPITTASGTTPGTYTFKVQGISWPTVETSGPITLTVN